MCTATLQHRNLHMASPARLRRPFPLPSSLTDVTVSMDDMLCNPLGLMKFCCASVILLSSDERGALAPKSFWPQSIHPQSWARTSRCQKRQNPPTAQNMRRLSVHNIYCVPVFLRQRLRAIIHGTSVIFASPFSASSSVILYCDSCFGA